MARISKDDILGLIQAGNALITIFGGRKARARRDAAKARAGEILDFMSTAIETYDDLRGLGDRIEQAAARDEVYACRDIGETRLLASLVRNIRRAAQVAKGS